MAHQLLDGGQVGAGGEEITGVGPAQVMGRDGGQPGGHGAAAEDLTDGLAGEGVAEAKVAPPVDGAEERPGGLAPELHPLLEERTDRGGEGHQPLLAALAQDPDGCGVGVDVVQVEGDRARPDACATGRPARSSPAVEAVTHQPAADLRQLLVLELAEVAQRPHQPGAHLVLPRKVGPRPAATLGRGGSAAAGAAGYLAPGRASANRSTRPT